MLMESPLVSYISSSNSMLAARGKESSRFMWANNLCKSTLHLAEFPPFYSDREPEEHILPSISYQVFIPVEKEKEKEKEKEREK